MFIQRLFEEVVTYKVPQPAASPPLEDEEAGADACPPPLESPTPHGGVDAVAATNGPLDSPMTSGGGGGGDSGGVPGGWGGGGEGKAARTEGEMDYKTFLDLVLAMENKHTRQVCDFCSGAPRGGDGELGGGVSRICCCTVQIGCYWPKQGVPGDGSTRRWC